MTFSTGKEAAVFMIVCVSVYEVFKWLNDGIVSSKEKMKGLLWDCSGVQGRGRCDWEGDFCCGEYYGLRSII